MHSKISVIVPNYNHSSYLKQRMDSIFNQTYQDFEVILLDDCSTDDSWEILKTYSTHPKVTYCIKNEVNSGSPFKQWKKGIDLAQGDWIWIAESDDWASVEFLDELVNLNSNSVNIKYCCSLRVDNHQIKQKHISWNYLNPDTVLRWEKYYTNDGASEIDNYLSYINIIPNASAVIFKKPLIFPDSILKMKFSGDWYFWISLLEKGNISYSPKCLNYYRNHSQTTRSIKNSINESRRLTEGIICINNARKLSGKKEIGFLDIRDYKHLSKFVFETNLKTGRLNFNNIFPIIPFFLLPYYYYYYFKSILNYVKS